MERTRLCADGGVFCGKTDAADDAKLVARIGGKTLSVQEFEERAKELKQTGYNRVTEFDAEEADSTRRNYRA